MGQTPNYKLRTPENTDLVMDGALAVRNLAADTDNAIKKRTLTGAVTVPNDGTVSTRDVTWPLDWVAEPGLPTPRIALSVGVPEGSGAGPALYDGRPYLATWQDLAPHGFTIRVCPVSTGSGGSTISGPASVVVHWTATTR